MSEKKPEFYVFGLLITKAFEYQDRTASIRVHVVRKALSDESHHDGSIALGCNSIYSWHLPKSLQGLEFDDLKIRGHIYESGAVSDDGTRRTDRTLIGYQPEYHDQFSLDLPKARSCVKTLTRFNQLVAKWRKDNGNLEVTPAVNFLLLAKLVNAKYVVYRDGTQRGPYKPVREEDALSVTNGLHKYLGLIETWKQEWVDPYRPRSVA